MKRRYILFLFLLLLAPLEGQAGTVLNGSVTEVFDGDTVLVFIPGRGPETVRYIGIDTPETNYPGRRVEELGPEASRFNREMVLGREVLLELDVQERDRFGRLLAYVWLDHGTGGAMVNEVLVREGYAVPFTFPPNLRHTKLFRNAFRKARNEGKPLWGKASGRVFTPVQVWAELPYLAGLFLTVEFRVEDVTESANRYSLHPARGYTSLIIYKSDSGQFGSIASFRGKTLTVAGKVLSGFNGAEIVLSDPAQILSVQ
jgi:micrococcal nuclease